MISIKFICKSYKI